MLKSSNKSAIEISVKSSIFCAEYFVRDHGLMHHGKCVKQSEVEFQSCAKMTSPNVSLDLRPGETFTKPAKGNVSMFALYSSEKNDSKNIYT